MGEKLETNVAEPGMPEAKPKPSAGMIRREVGEDGICVLTFDRPGSSANIFDRGTLEELNDHLNFLDRSSGIKGVVVTSAKPSIFIAGADLHALGQLKGAEQLGEYIRLGQGVFSRLEALGIPTVAAIHGACVGGGYEICLACNYRIASPEKATKIGLPETQLGIVPAWGGSTRLPRLIGLPKALDVILAGKTLAAKQALRYGMVDELVPKEYLVERARKLILSRGKRLSKRPITLAKATTNNALVGGILKKRLLPKLLLKTGGHYPAIPKALQVVTEGIGLSRRKSMDLEFKAILELADTETCRNLMRIFLLQERARKISGVPGNEAVKVKPVKQAAVIGAGVMGSGIAQWTSAREISVILKDINAGFVGKGMANISRLYDQGVKKHSFTKVEARAGMDRIHPTATDVPLKNVDMVIEAAVEKMNLKKEVFRKLDELAGPETILATNTSALSVSELAESTAHPDRVVGIHFFNPVHKMQLVEVIVGRQTSPEVVRRAVKFVQQIGKLPVVVQDSPGFLVNRILMPYLLEAGNLFEAGARVEDIDEAMLEFGMPMGPLRLIDEVGVDVSEHVADTLANHFKPRMQVPEVLGKMMKAGWLGRKSKKGFYEHVDGKE
ncbi:MAG: fatty-acid oxidation protein subunit alpha, partial [Verrucomicrobiales bacterium]|nr:fatty-acid oxidation protein subunit alpha [Verrucomicrobiales bacterium]